MEEKRVNYGEIKTYCEELTSLSKSFKETINVIDTTISKIKSPIWAGYAANNYVEKLKKLSDCLPDANKQLAEAVLFLASCADAYQSIDKESLEALKELIGGQDYIDNYDVNNATTVDLNARLQRKDVLIIKEKVENNYPQVDNQTRVVESGSTVVPLVSSIPSNIEVLDDKYPDDELNKQKMVEEDKETVIPSSINQEELKTKLYDKSAFERESKEDYIYKLWEGQEASNNNNLAILKIDEENYYLVKTSPTYGEVGDIITLTLEDGTSIKCIIAEHQEQVNNYNEFGVITNDGKTQIIEFEIKQETNQELSTTANSFELKWDNEKAIKSISNNGEIVGVLKADKTKIVSSMMVDKEITKIRENMISVATKEIGNSTEGKYIEIFGEKEGNAWDSEFVSWCADKNGYVAEEIVPKFADAKTGVNWFKANELFQNKGYTPNAGDIIFVGSNEPSHTALVEKVENNVIYTIEGNVNDVVKRKTIHVEDSNIYGYGTPDYSKIVMKTIE